MTEMIPCPDEDNCEPYGEHYRLLQAGRCIRCSNYLVICGHNLGFAEKAKSIGIDRASLRA